MPPPCVIAKAMEGWYVGENLSHHIGDAEINV
jgi:hypothetical protein